MASVRDIRSLRPDDLIFKNSKYVFHFAGIGDIVPSIEQPIDYMDTNATLPRNSCRTYRQL